MARKKSRRHPGEGSIWLRADTGRYQAALVIGWTPLGNARRMSRSFDTRTEAVAWLSDQQRELRRGSRLDSNATLTGVFEDWMISGETLAAWAQNDLRQLRSRVTALEALAAGETRTLVDILKDYGLTITPELGDALNDWAEEFIEAISQTMQTAFAAVGEGEA